MSDDAWNDWLLSSLVRLYTPKTKEQSGQFREVQIEIQIRYDPPIKPIPGNFQLIKWP